jgi:hypothetical protein
MDGVILCTEQGYDEKALERAVCGQEYRTEYKSQYVEMIQKIVEELLLEGKTNKL